MRWLPIAMVLGLLGCDADERARCVDPDGTGTRAEPRAALTLGAPVDGQACAQVSDWLGIPATATQIRITAEGEVVAELFRGAEVLRSERGADLRWTLDEAADRISLRAGEGAVAYTVTADGAPDCPGPEAVHDVEVDGPTLALCAGEPAVVRVPGSSETYGSMSLSGSAQFAVDVRIGPWRERWTSVNDHVLFSNGLGRPGTATVVSDRDQRVEISLTSGPAPVTRAQARVGVAHKTRAVTADGLGPVESVPTQGALVTVNSPGQLFVAAALTDDRGTAALDFPAEFGPAEAVWRVTVWGAVVAGPDRVTVTRRLGVPWEQTLKEIVEAGDAGELELDDDATGIALRIARTAADGLESLRAARPSLPPFVLEIVWAPEQASACGTCYRPGETPHIELSGRASDPDQWDDAVIWHEVAHVVTDTACEDDSPGGAHGDPPTTPTVAWSEGFATYLSSWIAGDAVQLDYRVVGVRQLDISELPAELEGTTDGTVAGDVSERLVATLLWRLDEALGDAAVLEAVFGQLPTRADVGVAGADLVDFLDALVCVASPELIGSAVDSVAFPYAPTCR